MTHGDRVSGVLLRGVAAGRRGPRRDVAAHLVSGRLQDLVPGGYRVMLGRRWPPRNLAPPWDSASC